MCEKYNSIHELTFSSFLMLPSTSVIRLLSLFNLLSISAIPLTPETLFLSISDFSSSLALEIIKKTTKISECSSQEEIS